MYVSDGMLQPLWTEEEEELTLSMLVIDSTIKETQRGEEDQSSDDTDYYDFDDGVIKNDMEEGYI